MKGNEDDVIMKPEPGADESRDDFMGRCIPIVMEHGTAENRDQAVAVCSSMWENRALKLPRMGDLLRTDEFKAIKVGEIRGIEFGPGTGVLKAMEFLEVNGLRGPVKAAYGKDGSVKVVLFEDGKGQKKRVRVADGIIAVCAKENSGRGSGEGVETKMNGLLERPKRCRFHMEAGYVEKDGALTIEGFASTGEVDRDGDIVIPKAFEKSLSGYMENPVLCYMHDWKAPIGLVTDARIVGSNEKVFVGTKSVNNETGGLFVRAEVSTTNKEIRELIKQGVLKAFSIGFAINEDDWDDEKEARTITDLELFEISVVSIPSNRRSLFSVTKALVNGSDVMDEKGAVVDVPDEGALSGYEAVKARIAKAREEGRLVLKSATSVIDDCVELKEEYDATLKRLTACVKAGFEAGIKDSGIITDEDAERVAEIVMKKAIERETDAKYPNLVVDDPYELIENRTRTMRDNAVMKSSKVDEAITDWLDVKFEEQRILTKTYPSYKTALVCKALKERTADGLRRVDNVDYQGDRERPVFAYFWTGRASHEELLLEGRMFIEREDGLKFVLWVYPVYGGYTVRTYYARRDAGNVLDFADGTDVWMDKNNFFRGEKITPSGRFLPIPTTKFEDVKMPDEKRQAIKVGAVDFFERKEKYAKAGAPFKRGMIFSGPPGVGKTMTGRAIMATTKTTFIWAGAAELNCIGDLFAMARELAPSIMFVEDIDDYLQYYGAVDELKSEMDGMNAEEGLVTILCTNFPEKLPEALIDRPSRFDDVIKFELPTEDERYDILDMHGKGMEIEDREKNLREVAGKTDGLTGAHLKEILLFAMLVSLDEGRDKIGAKDLERSLKKIKRTRAENATGRRKSGAKMFKAAGDPDVLELSGTTDSQEGEYPANHKHEYKLTVTRDVDGKVLKVEGLAARAGEGDGHEHPIMQAGKTEIAENHYHRYSVAGGEVPDEERAVTVPVKLMEEIVDELTKDRPDVGLLMLHLEYLEDVLKGDADGTAILKLRLKELKSAIDVADAL